MDKKDISYVLKIIVYIILFSLLFDKAVYFSLNAISDHVFSGQSVGKLNQYLKIKDSLDIVIYGSSRANHNVNPSKLAPKSFNMGVDGRKLAYAGTLIKLLPKHKEQTLLIQIDTKNAFNPKYKAGDLDALKIKYNRNQIIKKEINRWHQNNPLQSIYWSIDYNGKVLGIIKNRLKPKYDYKKYNGFDPIHPSKTQHQIFLNKLRLKMQTKCKDSFTLNPIYNSYLDEIKSFSKNNNKKIVFFTAPIYNDKCISDNNFLKKIMKEKGLTYYDFTDFFSHNNHLRYWKDEIHLSYLGADVFSDALKDTLLKNK